MQILLTLAPITHDYIFGLVTPCASYKYKRSLCQSVRNDYMILSVYLTSDKYYGKKTVTVVPGTGSNNVGEICSNNFTDGVFIKVI